MEIIIYEISVIVWYFFNPSTKWLNPLNIHYVKMRFYASVIEEGKIPSSSYRA